MILAGNWKMNLTLQEAEKLVYTITNRFLKKKVNETNHQLILFPSFPFISPLAYQLKNTPNLSNFIKLGAQNCHHKPKGAYTGEVSVSMLKSLGVEYVLIGHSERRKYFNENDAMLSKKLTLALSNNIKVVFCCGENALEKKARSSTKAIQRQLKGTLLHLDTSSIQNVIIAYEPSWAIGSGVTPTIEEIHQVHQLIRSELVQKYGVEIAYKIPLLYGGSCNESNAQQIMSCKNVDGGLIGAASLKASSFLRIFDQLNK